MSISNEEVERLVFSHIRVSEIKIKMKERKIDLPELMAGSRDEYVAALDKLLSYTLKNITKDILRVKR